MVLGLQPVTSPRDVYRFVTFPWRIYQRDRYWVPPLIGEQMAKLDGERNPFWRNAERALWIARQGKTAVGTIAAIVDHAHNRVIGDRLGEFGFFECVDDQEVATALLTTAEDWLRARGLRSARGPYNPSNSDEYGLLVAGFDTRPALLEAHTPPYYRRLLEDAGYAPHLGSLAWLARADAGARCAEDVLPPRLVRVAERALALPGVRVRPVDVADWTAEIDRACALYNGALATLPEYVPVSEDEFRHIAAGFRAFIDPACAQIVEVDGRPAGFALALPDLNEALQHANGRLWPFGALKIWWFSRRLTRASFKILAVLPQYRVRGLEAALILQIGRALWAKGFREVDLSMTGEENLPMTTYLSNLGLNIYRQYRVYQKAL